MGILLRQGAEKVSEHRIRVIKPQIDSTSEMRTHAQCQSCIISNKPKVKQKFIIIGTMIYTERPKHIDKQVYFQQIQHAKKFTTLNGQDHIHYHLSSSFIVVWQPQGWIKKVIIK
jgi:hypothetical protein